MKFLILMWLMLETAMFTAAFYRFPHIAISYVNDFPFQACMFGTCINTEGDYVCKCPPDHELIGSGTGCVGEFI